jgi:methyl-accepting chemotaxis protein
VPTIPPPPAAAPPPPPPTLDATDDDERLDDIATQLDLLATAVAAHTERLATTQARLAEIDELDELLAATRSDQDDTDDDEIVALRQQLTDVSERVNGMDTRVTNISTELANQLTELSRDIDELNRRSQEAADAAATTGGSDDEMSASTDIDTTEIEARLAERLDAAIDDVLDTTERLAAEQARYEIKFRADLAELAERLRRPNAQ